MLQSPGTSYLSLPTTTGASNGHILRFQHPPPTITTKPRASHLRSLKLRFVSLVQLQATKEMTFQGQSYLPGVEPGCSHDSCSPEHSSASPAPSSHSGDLRNLSNVTSSFPSTEQNASEPCPRALPSIPRRN